MNNYKNIDAVLKELKSFELMKEELNKEIEELQKEAKLYMVENNIDEVITTDGAIKATFREVVSYRMQTSLMKKTAPELWARWAKETKAMRFTLN